MTKTIIEQVKKESIAYDCFCKNDKKIIDEYMQKTLRLFTEWIRDNDSQRWKNTILLSKAKFNAKLKQEGIE